MFLQKVTTTLKIAHAIFQTLDVMINCLTILNFTFNALISDFCIRHNGIKLRAIIETENGHENAGSAWTQTVQGTNAWILQANNPSSFYRTEGVRYGDYNCFVRKCDFKGI